MGCLDEAEIECSLDDALSQWAAASNGAIEGVLLQCRRVFIPRESIGEIVVCVGINRDNASRSALAGLRCE